MSLNLLERLVQSCMQSAQDSSHDWLHIQRVRQIAKSILRHHPESDAELVDLAALCHDLGDHKLTSMMEHVSARQALLQCGYSDLVAESVQGIVDNVSFSKELKRIEKVGWEQVLQECSIELAIVQDADRLDAMGAIGVARCFAYNGKQSGKFAMYNPDALELNEIGNVTSGQYAKGSTAFHHFYDKLLGLKDMLKTPEGKQEAIRRQAFMLEFLSEFKQDVLQI